MSDILDAWKKIRLAPCEAPLYARGGHLQTLLGFMLPSPLFFEKTEEFLLPLKDGDTLHGRIIEGRSTLVVYLFHGLGGSLDSNYIQRTARIAHRLGATVVMGNHRGSGEGERLAERPYHSGSADDLSEFIAHGRKRWPTHTHLSIGFSLSANASLLMAAGVRATVLPDAAITVNAPVDLRVCSLALTSGLNRIYDLSFMRDMRALTQNRTINGRPITLSRFATLFDFDEAYTGPAAGFANRDEYYARSSANQYGTAIRIPTFVITAADDPFIPVRVYEEMKFSKQVILHIEKTGGHLGYLTGRLPKPQQKTYGHRWLDYALDALIAPLVLLPQSPAADPLPPEV